MLNPDLIKGDKYIIHGTKFTYVGKTEDNQRPGMYIYEFIGPTKPNYHYYEGYLMRNMSKVEAGLVIDDNIIRKGGSTYPWLSVHDN